MASRLSGQVNTFLLNKASINKQRYAAKYGIKVISSKSDLRESLGLAPSNSLWISNDKGLTDSFAGLFPLSRPKSVNAVIVHDVELDSLPVLNSGFKHLFFSVNGGFLPLDELAEALTAENRADLFIGGSVSHASEKIVLLRGDLKSLKVPFSAFEVSGNGTAPDFSQFSVTDYGQTIRLGEYEAAGDAILYELDPIFRRKISKARKESEKSFGAALRRLRCQRRLRQEDFAPIAAKTIARIERGEVQRIQKSTREAIAKRLRVKPEEIETY